MLGSRSRYRASHKEHPISTRPATHSEQVDLIEPPVERELELAAAAVQGRSDHAVALAIEVGRWLPDPGRGGTAVRWCSLSALAAGDLTAARVVEAHTDALAILSEARTEGHAVDVDGPVPAGVGARADSTWGVFAAEGPGLRVDAEQDGDRWLLTGTKPWCSLAGHLTHALITAHTAGGGRRLFAVALRQPGVRADADGWVARGLADVPSNPLHLQACPAVPVGPDGWYLRRPGFAWGGIGVAACWYGGTVAVARRLREAALAKDPDLIAAMHLGAVDAALTAARAVLADSAAAIDDGRAAGSDGVLLAARVRAVVASAAEGVLRHVGHALGPAPLAREETHARRVADLELYLRQHHAERDEAALGRTVLNLAEWV